MFCENCGAEIKDGTKCTECGKDFGQVSLEETVVLDNTANETSDKVTAAPKKKKKFPVVLIIILIIAVLLLPLVLLIVLGIAILGVGGVLALIMRVETPAFKPNTDNQIVSSETVQISDDMLGIWYDAEGNTIEITEDGEIVFDYPSIDTTVDYEIILPNKIRVEIDNQNIDFEYVDGTIKSYTDGVLDGYVYSSEPVDIPYSLSDITECIVQYERYSYDGSVCNVNYGSWDDERPDSVYEALCNEYPEVTGYVDAYGIYTIPCCDSKDEALEHLHQYFGPAFELNGYYFESDGALYYAQGGRGGFLYSPDLDNITVTRLDYNQLEVSVPYYWDFEIDDDFTRVFYFEYIDGAYKIVNVNE